MPRSLVVIYREDDGSSPFVEWFEELPAHARDKEDHQNRATSEGGHELRRPEADFLRDGIYELRATARGVHYRVLYFFHRQVAAVVAQGVIKESKVPDREIDIALRRKARFEANPSKHTLEED